MMIATVTHDPDPGSPATFIPYQPVMTALTAVSPGGAVDLERVIAAEQRTARHGQGAGGADTRIPACPWDAGFPCVHGTQRRPRTGSPLSFGRGVLCRVNMEAHIDAVASPGP